MRWQTQMDRHQKGPRRQTHVQCFPMSGVGCRVLPMRAGRRMTLCPRCGRFSRSRLKHTVCTSHKNLHGGACVCAVSAHQRRCLKSHVRSSPATRKCGVLVKACDSSEGIGVCLLWPYRVLSQQRSDCENKQTRVSNTAVIVLLKCVQLTDLDLLRTEPAWHAGHLVTA